MALFKTLRSLLRNPNPRSRLSFHTSSSPFTLSSSSSSSSYSSPASSSSAVAAAPDPFSFVLRLTSAHSALFSPATLPRRVPHFSGPLFLSSPPWKLSQSATPLYLRGREVVFPKDLLRGGRFPNIGEVGRAVVGDVIGWRKERSVDGEVGEVRVDEKFLNLPNLVSISRLVSGPVIGWYVPFHP